MTSKAAKKAQPKDSPFGGPVRKRALARYFATAGELTAANAWEHVYRLLLSIDRRTQLAHVMDSNHMQPGGAFYSRAVRFTDLLCERWEVTRDELPDHVDVMFKACVAEYLAKKSRPVARAVQQTIEQLVDAGGGSQEVEEEVSEFLLDIAELLATKLGITKTPELMDLVGEIERRAEHYFTIEKKRQNVRGEGFEDTLEWMLLESAGVPRGQLVVRTEANLLPGFKKPLKTGKKKDKVPKPDLAITSPSKDLTLWIITAKWSLRQDRLDTFGQEAAYYRDHKIQTPKLDFVLVTNEMDVARLRAVLSPPEGGGGFHFDRVYHVQRDLLEEVQGDKFEDLALYKAEERLLSLEDLITHATIHFKR
jgi:hypothetical protein